MRSSTSIQSKIIQTILQKQKYKIISSTSWRPQSNRHGRTVNTNEKKRLAVFDIDLNWSTVPLANRVANIIESIRLIPSSTSKITPFEAQFGQKPNRETSNITTKPSKHNLKYKNLTNKCLEKKILSQNIQQNPQSSGTKDNNQLVQLNSDSDNSENVSLSKTQKKFTPTRKIHPSEIHFTLDDKTTKDHKTQKNVERKLLARKTKEPRHTLAPKWNIIEDGTITGYSPHTITIDTLLRKNTVIRKND